MPASVLTQPIASTPGVPASAVAVATTNQLSRVSQATRSGAGTVAGARIITGDDHAASTDTYIGADTTLNTVTLTLFKVSEYRSGWLLVEQYKAGNTFTVEVNPNTSDTLDGSSSISVTKACWIVPISAGLFHVIAIGN
jgi:hypothetical protein